MKKIFIFCFIFMNIFIQQSYAQTDVAIIGAMDCEIGYFKNYLKHTQKGYGKTIIYKGKIGKNDVVVAKCLIGKVNAASMTQYLIDKYHPKYIINTGTAGSLNPNIKIGTIIIGKNLIQFDYNMTPGNYSKGCVDLPDNKDFSKPTLFKSDEKLVNSMINFLNNSNQKYFLATIGTGDVYVTDKKEKDKYKQLFKIDVMEMEGAATAQTALLNDVPCVVIRNISDFGNDKEYEQNKEKIGELCAKFLCDYFLKNKI